MAYRASDPEKFTDTSVGNGQCVAFAQAAARLGHTSTWKRGVLVRGAVIAKGTAIATFDKDGRYQNDTHGRSHAAIYLGQDATGIQVLDQWVERTRMPDGSIRQRVQPAHKRTIRFQHNARAVNDGRNYYVIE